MSDSILIILHEDPNILLSAHNTLWRWQIYALSFQFFAIHYSESVLFLAPSIDTKYFVHCIIEFLQVPRSVRSVVVIELVSAIRDWQPEPEQIAHHYLDSIQNAGTEILSVVKVLNSYIFTILLIINTNLWSRRTVFRWLLDSWPRCCVTLSGRMVVQWCSYLGPKIWKFSCFSTSGSWDSTKTTSVFCAASGSFRYVWSVAHRLMGSWAQPDSGSSTPSVYFPFQPSISSLDVFLSPAHTSVGLLYYLLIAKPAE